MDVRHNASHQVIREGAPFLWGDHYADECGDETKRFKAAYAPGSGPREQDDPYEEDE